MDALTSDDIAAAMNDLAVRGEHISRTASDGSRERIDPLDFYKSAKE